MINVLKRILKVLVISLMAVIFILTSYNFVNINILKNDYSSYFGYTVLEVISGSMEPNISVGDMIVIDIKDNNYNAGDVVTFYDVNGSFVTHRIIEINEEEVITKGDNNNSNDEAIGIDRILGKYKFKINNGGRIIGSFKSPLTLITIFIMGVLVSVLLSTDKDGNPILDEDEKELEEFRKFKKQKQEALEKNEIKERVVKNTDVKENNKVNKNLKKSKKRKKSKTKGKNKKKK